MPYFRHTSPADSPAACSFSTLMICSSVNLLLRMSVSRRNGLYLKSRAFKGSRSGAPKIGRYSAADRVVGVGLFNVDWTALRRIQFVADRHGSPLGVCLQ